MPVSFRVNPEYARISEIVPGLMICGVSALDAETMKKNRVTHIINATTEVSLLNLAQPGKGLYTIRWFETF